MTDVSPYGAAYPQGVDDDEINLDLPGIFRFLRRRKAIILSVTAIGTVVAAILGYNVKPSYTSEALLMIASGNQVVDLGSAVGGDVTGSAAVATEMSVLTSRGFLDQVAERLYAREIEDAPERMDLDSLRDESQTVVGSLWTTFEEMLPEDWVVATGVATEPVRMSDEEKRQVIRNHRAGEMASRLRVDQIRNSYVISVNYTSTNPIEAARVANGIVNLYIDDQVNRKKTATGRATEFLEQRLVELEKEVRDSEEAVQNYAEKSDLIEGAGIEVNSQQMTELTNMQVDARAARKEREARLRYIRDLQSRGESLESLSEVLQSPYIVSLWQDESNLRRQEAELRGVYGDKHPAIQNIVAEEKKVQERVQVEIKRIVANLENELTVIKEREASIKSDMDALIAKSGEAGKSAIELRRLDREAQASRSLYETFLQRYKETREQQAVVEANGRVIAPAIVPSSPSSRSPLFFVGAGFVISGMLGVLLGFVRERFDNGIRSGKEVEATLGIPCLGLVPYLSSRQRNGKKLHEYLVSKPLSTYTETLRSLYTALRLNNVDNPPKVIQVSSSVPAEGKTSLVVSLAAALALDGKKVLLLDCDLRHPSVRREIETAGRGCLVSYLTGDCELDEALKHDDAGQFDVIDVRRTPPNPSRLLGSKRMRDLLEHLREVYDFIVVDGPPVLGVSDSKVIMELVDSVLYVIRWEKTTLDTAGDAVKEMRSCGADIVGAVITQVDIERHAQYGYGGIDAYYSKYNKYYVN